MDKRQHFDHFVAPLLRYLGHHTGHLDSVFRRARIYLICYVGFAILVCLNILVLRHFLGDGEPGVSARDLLVDLATALAGGASLLFLFSAKKTYQRGIDMIRNTPIDNARQQILLGHYVNKYARKTLRLNI